MHRRGDRVEGPVLLRGGEDAAGEARQLVEGVIPIAGAALMVEFMFR
jgi:hypothetical protein